MSLGLIPLAIAAIGAAYSAIVLRGWRRRDNLMFGLLALTDALMTAWRGLNVLTGGSIVSRGVLTPCAFGTIILALLTLEFVAAFPRQRPMAWRWRAVMLAWGASGVVIAATITEPGNFADPSNLIAELTFYTPATLLVFGVGLRSFLRTSQRDARIVIGVMWFRWFAGTLTWVLGPLLGGFEAMAWIETTFATMVSFAVIGTAVLRSELFSIRSSAVEVVTIATCGLLVVLGGGGAVSLALAHVAPGRLQELALFGAALVPLVLAAIGYAMYPRVERRVLAGLDERRARRLGVQGDPLPADAAAAIAEASARISSIGDGATVRWVANTELPADLAAQLSLGEPLRKGEIAGLPACFIVPALGAERVLVGAFYLDDGLIDRDTYVVARDLAARVALAVQRAQAVSELLDARRLAALGQFAAAIAHDIRTPLTSISMNVQILRRKLQLPDDDREHLDIALEELARLDRSVAEILDFAKPVKLMSEPIDVAELIETTKKNLSPVLFERGVAVQIEPSTGRDALTVQGDPQRLRQVLTNLVDNAANASRPGAAVTLRAVATADRGVAIEVEDHGRGIGADDLPRIFEPFFTTRPDGTGLGLAIVHKVIRAHGGDIKVKSTLGAGSTFTITLPQPV
ncbi:MAG TPA: ATP-binding protein [Kofleriaceae bacterium]|nr:ATP-binding protein [Kofleriaceae bacterium]